MKPVATFRATYHRKSIKKVFQAHPIASEQSHFRVHATTSLPPKNTFHTKQSSKIHFHLHFKCVQYPFLKQRVINHHFRNVWPSRSPDQNFLLWWYLKRFVDRGHARILRNIKDNISRQNFYISKNLLLVSVEHAILQVQTVLGQFWSSHCTMFIFNILFQRFQCIYLQVFLFFVNY